MKYVPKYALIDANVFGDLDSRTYLDPCEHTALTNAIKTAKTETYDIITWHDVSTKPRKNGMIIIRFDDGSFSPSTPGHTLQNWLSVKRGGKTFTATHWTYDPFAKILK